MAHSVSAVMAVTALLSGAACTGSGSESPTASPRILSADDVEYRSLQLANMERSAGSIEPQLGLDPLVAAIARSHSIAMRDQGFLGHTDGSGTGLRQRLDSAGVRYRSAAENLVQVSHASRPAAVAHGQLMSSASHRRNLLGSEFRLAGVGVAKAGDTYWITQIFIKP